MNKVLIMVFVLMSIFINSSLIAQYESFKAGLKEDKCMSEEEFDLPTQITYYKRMLVEDSTNCKVWYSLGMYYSLLKLDSALIVFDRFIEKEACVKAGSFWQDAFITRALIKWGLGNAEGACVDLNVVMNSGSERDEETRRMYKVICEEKIKPKKTM